MLVPVAQSGEAVLLGRDLPPAPPTRLACARGRTPEYSDRVLPA